MKSCQPLFPPFPRVHCFYLSPSSLSSFYLFCHCWWATWLTLPRLDMFFTHITSVGTVTIINYHYCSHFLLIVILVAFYINTRSFINTSYTLHLEISLATLLEIYSMPKDFSKKWHLKCQIKLISEISCFLFH